MTRNLSIGLRLTLWYLIIFAAAQLIFGIGMWFILRHHLYDIADDALEAQVDDVQRFLESQRPDASTAKLKEEVTETYTLEHSGDYLQIENQDGDWIYRSAYLERHDLPRPRADQLQKPRLEDRDIGGQSFRFRSEDVEVYGRHFLVQTGVPEDDVIETLTVFKRYLLLFAALILLAASAVGYWLSRRALSPVDAITQTARSISGTNLSSRLEQLNTGDELQRLSDTLNQMLGRIETSFLRVSQFTADASHELRTPISLIRTEAEIALRKTRSDVEYQEALRHILEEAEGMSSLIEKLLALARADAGREALDIRPLDLRSTVLEATHDWANEMATHDLRFTPLVSDREILVAADKTAIQRLLNILLDNAVRYTPATGSVDLKLEQDGDQAMIAVGDTGIGISAEEQSRIFERFYRVDKVRNHSHAGAGLGLSIARWIVEQHRGSIAVQSSLGKGSTFIVRLPVQEPLPEET